MIIYTAHAKKQLALGYIQLNILNVPSGSAIYNNTKLKTPEVP